MKTKSWFVPADTISPLLSLSSGDRSYLMTPHVSTPRPKGGDFWLAGRSSTSGAEAVALTDCPTTSSTGVPTDKGIFQRAATRRPNKALEDGNNRCVWLRVGQSRNRLAARISQIQHVAI